MSSTSIRSSANRSANVPCANRDGVLKSDFAGASRVAAGNGDGIEAGGAVCNEVAIADNEAGPDDADPPIGAARKMGGDSRAGF